MTDVGVADQVPRTKRALNRFITDVLDEMQVTDVEYHCLEYTRPMVTNLLLPLVQRSSGRGKVLVVGPDALLAEMLLKLGYDVDIWTFGEQLLPENQAEYIRGSVTPDTLLEGAISADDKIYDLIILPKVLEHLHENPVVLLRQMFTLLSPGGLLILSTANLGRLGVRLRALLGKGFLPDWKGNPPGKLDNWPILREYRFFQAGEIHTWSEESGFQEMDRGYTEGHHAYNAILPLGLISYLALKTKHFVKTSIPQLQDYLVFTLQKPGEQGGEEELAAPQERIDENLAADTKTRQDVLPFVTVAIPSRDRAHLLPEALTSAFKQDYPSDRYEILVINDGSVDNTEEVYEQLRPQAKCQMRYIKTTGIGTAAARNLATREAEGEIVAHTDDDCRLPTGWISAAVRAFEPGVAFVAGPILPKPEQTFTYFSWSMNHPVDNGTYPTSNIFYRREIFLDEGGFNETFGMNLLGRPVWGWDSDLAWRLIRKGYQARFAVGAVNYTEVFHLSPMRWVLESWRVSMIPTVVRFVPEIRKTLLYGRYFLSQDGFQFYLFLLGIILAIVFANPVWGLLMIPWTWVALKVVRIDWWPPIRWPKGIAKIGFLLGRFGLAVVAAFYGSIRARRLLL
jgi:glycosyltransferase involved in cell wall biosynthesis/SAM-dependent methyltransferase